MAQMLVFADSVMGLQPGPCISALPLAALEPQGQSYDGDMCYEVIPDSLRKSLPTFGLDFFYTTF